jgi:hypothetical protein
VCRTTPLEETLGGDERIEQLKRFRPMRTPAEGVSAERERRDGEAGRRRRFGLSFSGHG